MEFQRRRRAGYLVEWLAAFMMLLLLGWMLLDLGLVLLAQLKLDHQADEIHFQLQRNANWQGYLESQILVENGPLGFSKPIEPEWRRRFIASQELPSGKRTDLYIWDIKLKRELLWPSFWKKINGGNDNRFLKTEFKAFQKVTSSQ